MDRSVWLSHEISTNTPLYGGANNLAILPASKISDGASANSLNLELPNHSGTHIDVPRHFFDDGPTVSDYPADFWIFRTPQVVEVQAEANSLITPEGIAEKVEITTDLLLLRTGFEKLRLQPDYWKFNPGIAATTAKLLRFDFPHIRAVGIDTISITARAHRQEGRTAHRIFLNNNYTSPPIVLIEDMLLSSYQPWISNVIVSPLRIAGADGAPVTVLGLE